MPNGVDDVSDFELMERVQAGDVNAFAALVRRHQTALASFFRRLGAAHEAEDLTQEAFIRVYRYRETYSPTAQFTTFLYTIARNVWTDRWRKIRRWQKYRDETEYQLKTLDMSCSRPVCAAHLDVQAALQSLPEKMRIVLILSVYEGFSYPEISRILNIPVGTVKSRVFHALMRLKEFFDENAPRS